MGLLMEQLINITDAIFLGHVGEIELGASALASIYYMAIYMLGFGFSLGLQVLIARRNGEKNYLETGTAFFQGLFFLLTLALSLFILSKLVSPYILRSTISSDKVYDAVISYVDWRNFGLLFAFPALAFRAFFVGITKTKILTVSAIILVITNIVLNYLLIFGKFGFSRLGITGAAIASSLSELIALLVFIIYVVFMIDKREYGLSWKFDAGVLVQILKVSIWSMMQSFVSVAPWFLFFVVIEHLGERELAIANIIRSISTLFFVVVNSLATTTGSLVSNLIGAGEDEKVIPVCKKVINMGYFIGIPLVVLVFIFHNSVLNIYTDSDSLIQGAFVPFVVMLSNFFLALPSYVYCNAVTGTGKTKIAFIFQFVTIIFYLSYLYILTRFSKAPLAVYWTAEHLFVILILLFSYMYMRKWKHKIQFIPNKYDTEK